MGLAFFAFGIFFRLQAAKSKERIDRRQEGLFILIGSRLAGVISLAATVATVVSPERMGWASIDLPLWMRWAGVGCFAVSELWLIWMFRTLGHNLTDTVVTRVKASFVSGGPYRYVRNPMYSGVLMLGISLGLALATWLVPLLVGTVFAFLAVRTRIEERNLIVRFGDTYRDYMKRTPRFFPGIN
jgi:protein-S-isoprenylcysteine O-methyltransferase Ste14